MNSQLKSHSAIRWKLGVLWGLTFIVVLFSLRFVFLAIEQAQPFMVHHVEMRPLAFYGHVAAATVALAIVPFQFWKRLRTRNRTLHQWLGRTYGLAIFIGGVAGIWLGMTAEVAPFVRAGFSLLGAAWIFVTAIAIRFAMIRQFPAHRRWMIRSAALTLAAVTLRLYLPFLEMGFGFEKGYAIVSWLCWAPNLVFAEWLLRRETQRSLQAA